MNGRKILLGVCGGIAAYKAVELTRLFVKSGARVQVVMTAAAEKFITPLTFETITGRHVFVDMFPAHGDFSPWHTELASWPDLAVIAPATANCMARLAAGLADDLLTTVMLTLDRPRLLCPAMNHRMWTNPATQDNLSTLQRRGYRFVMPEEGQMARPGEEDGIGRLADLESVHREVSHILSSPQDLRGVRVLVTGGRTEESWDPVRVLTNRSTGRMGFALAEEARERGAEVVLVHGPTDVIPPSGVRIRRVTTAAEMASAVKQEFNQAKIVLMAAAVADYTFAKTAEHKIKKGEPSPEIQLIATEDILKSLADKKNDRIVVGFALETENLLENALKKLREKHLDIVVANNPLAQGSGFAVETNQVLLIHRSGRVTELPLQSKREAARDILNAVIDIYRNPEPEPEPEEELLLDEEEDVHGLDLSGLELEEATEERIPAVAATPALHPQPQQNERGGKHHKKHRDRDRDRDRNRPQGQPAQPAHQVTEHHAAEPAAAQQTSAPAPAPTPVAATVHAPRPQNMPRPERAPRPQPQPRPQPRPEAKPAPKPVVEAEAQTETVSDLPGSMNDGPQELPFPNAAPGAGPKKSRGRRGGRRAQRARAKRQAAEAAMSPEHSGAPAPESAHEPTVETQPVMKAPEPRPQGRPAPAPRPVPVPAPVVQTAPEPKPAPAPEPAPAPAPEPVVASEAAAPAEPVKAKKPRRAPGTGAPRKKPAAKKTAKVIAAENDGSSEE